MFRFLQNHPHFLEKVYDGMEKAIRPFKRWLKVNGSLQPLMIFVEKIGKGDIFDCQMCGQCILHSTGMTCPMTCPKNLRNGPCGGVRLDGHCEVYPDKDCVWTVAYERSLQMPDYGDEMIYIQPPINKQLDGSSSWINMLDGVDKIAPKGWVMVDEIEVMTI